MYKKKKHWKTFSHPLKAIFKTRDKFPFTKLFPFKSPVCIRGFSLVEVLLALVILSSGLLLLTNSWGGSFLRIKKLNIRNKAYGLLQQKMAEVEKEYENGPLTEIPEILEEEIEGHPGIRWRLESQPLEFPDLTPLLTSQDGGAQASLIYIIGKVQEYLKMSVKEVRVTLLLPVTKQKTQSYSVSTYFIQYQPFNVPELQQLQQLKQQQESQQQ